MPERKAQKIADAADMIVGGYAMLRHKQGVRIVNLFSGHVALVSSTLPRSARSRRCMFMRETKNFPSPSRRSSSSVQTVHPC